MHRFKKSIMILLSIVFIIVLLCCITNIFIPKGVEIRWFSPKSTFSGFYGMEQNSVDVLFLGTSKCYNSFSPQQLYNEYGIRSYNLGSSMQSTVITYYWLREALKYQKPKVVVFEVYNLFQYPNPNYGTLNSTEGQIRYSVDYMRLSKNKIDCIKDICRLDDSLEINSFLFPLIRYHNRYGELNEDDLTVSGLSYLKKLKGYKPAFTKFGDNTYQPFSKDDNYDKESIMPLMEEYLTKMIDLCRENGIEMILVHVPCNSASKLQYVAINELSVKNNISFFDFNETELFSDIGYDFALDNTDGEHPGFTGATKITAFIGKILSDKGLENTKDKQYEVTREYYQYVSNIEELLNTRLIEDYKAISEGMKLVYFVSEKTSKEKTQVITDFTELNDDSRVVGVIGSKEPYYTVNFAFGLH